MDTRRTVIREVGDVGRMGRLAFVASVTMLLTIMALNVYDKTIRHFSIQKVREAELSDIAIAAAVFALGTILIGVLQIRVMSLQIRQADELANRKDEALISAVSELTIELRKRPAPNPSVVKFSLFGVKK